MYTVVAQRQIPVPVGKVWDYLTRPALLARWFADTEHFGPDAPVLMEVGDGDFFAGRVVEWDPGIILCVRWRFVGCGPEYEVRYSLLRRKQGTELTVQDRGALTVKEAECLRVGWSEFLMRLEKSLLKDVNTRYSWRKDFVFTTRVDETKLESLKAALADPRWYRSALAGVRAQVHEPRGDELAATLTCDAWGGVETRARVRFEKIRGVDYGYVSHVGWPKLPAGIAEAERKRFVRVWLDALSEFSLDRSGGAARAAVG